MGQSSGSSHHPYLRIGVGEDEPERFEGVGLEADPEFLGDGRRAPAPLRLQLREGEGVVAVAQEGPRPALPPVRHGRRRHAQLGLRGRRGFLSPPARER